MKYKTFTFKLFFIFLMVNLFPGLRVSAQVDRTENGTITCSTETTEGEEKEKAFDNSLLNKCLMWSPTGWLSYDFAGSEAYIVTSYSVASANDVPARDPKDWILQGSNNGTTWDDIDTRSNETFASRHLVKGYSCSGNTVAYQMYRLNVSANSGDDFLQLSEIQLFDNSSGECINPSITVQPQSITRGAGTSASLSVTAIGTSLAYQWKKDGTSILGATSSTYNISSVASGDASNYTVVVIGACDSPVTSKTATLTVTNPDDYIIQGQTYTNTDDVWTGVNIERDTKKNFSFLNNSITSINTSGYMLQAGDENPSWGFNNNLDGEIIAGNKFTWNGTDMASITHGLFTGCNINAVIKYNYLYQVPMGVIRKSGSNMVNTSGGVAYNVFNKGLDEIVVKGMSGVLIYNNTFYSNRTFANTVYGRGIIDIYTNTDIEPNSVSHGTKIKNNIFYTVNKINNIRIIDADCLTDFECDYNVYYCEAGEPVFDYEGVQKTFKQWQALGYDTHSIVINPNFISNTLIPSDPLYHGKDLGSDWDQGLSPTAEWGTSAPAVVKQDSSIWQCGAYIIPPAPMADYYVAPYGNDNNIGDITHPFATLTRAWTKIQAGNLVYLRGGTYLMPTSQELKGKSGTSGHPIKIWAYPGEVPVITKVSSGWTYANRSGIYLEGNYFHWKGITVTGFTQINDNIWNDMIIQNANHNILEQMVFSYSGIGFDLSHYSTDNLILNCDFHHCYDPLTSYDPYGNGDGANAHTDFGTTNTFKGCRFWLTSDDGLDLYNGDGLIIIDGCWAWMNGYREDQITDGGDGYGYKLGQTSTDYSGYHIRTVLNSLAFNNGYGGFSQQNARGIFWVYNNTTYHNTNKPGQYRLGYEFDNNNVANILKNNIGYANQQTDGLEANWTAQSTEDHNSWDEGFSVTDADFISLDPTGVDGPRQADGSLPDLDFLKLAPTSKLINAGVDVNLPFSGAAPDLGAFEAGWVTGSPNFEIQNGSFLIYPNPVRDILTISTIRDDVKEVSLKLFDIRGIELYGSTETGDCKLNLSRYQPGIYFLEIICEGKISVRKIMKN